MWWMHAHPGGCFVHGFHWCCCGTSWACFGSSEDRLEWLKKVRESLEKELRWVEEEIARGEKKE